MFNGISGLTSVMNVEFQAAGPLIAAPAHPKMSEPAAAGLQLDPLPSPGWPTSPISITREPGVVVAFSLIKIPFLTVLGCLNIS